MGRIDGSAGRIAAAGRRGDVRMRPTARATNLTLFGTLSLVFATGVGAVATGSVSGRWIVIAHGVAAFMVVLLIPWKAIVIRRGLRRRRLTRWVSLLLALMVVTTLVAGMASVTGLVREVGGFLTLWWHIALALALVPLLLWHLASRPVRLRGPRPVPTAGMSRRAALRMGAIAGGAAAAYSVGEATLRLAGAPGAQRRFTGSHRIASTDPAAMPVTSWLDDRVPTIDRGRWQLAVHDAAGLRKLALTDLTEPEVTIRATLDCTSGWYADHDWTGVPLSALLTPPDHARSVYVHSVTGYWRRLPVEDLDDLLLATAVGGKALTRGHGFPLRLVAPGRRGFWWVKWVDRIALTSTPPWWQPPLPLT
jgi:DMSO/TMAO reductase YedYZ molybdopterin-dependent catalytic subunit